MRPLKRNITALAARLKADRPTVIVRRALDGSETYTQGGALLTPEQFAAIRDNAFVIVVKRVHWDIPAGAMVRP